MAIKLWGYVIILGFLTAINGCSKMMMETQMLRSIKLSIKSKTPNSPLPLKFDEEVIINL